MPDTDVIVDDMLEDREMVDDILRADDVTVVDELEEAEEPLDDALDEVEEMVDDILRADDVTVVDALDEVEELMGDLLEEATEMVADVLGIVEELVDDEITPFWQNSAGTGMRVHGVQEGMVTLDAKRAYTRPVVKQKDAAPPVKLRLAHVSISDIVNV